MYLSVQFGGKIHAMVMLNYICIQRQQKQIKVGGAAKSYHYGLHLQQSSIYMYTIQYFNFKNWKDIY